MLQIKIFVGIESEKTALCTEVNDWIASNAIKVVDVKGNIAPQTLAKENTSISNSGRSFKPSDLFVMVIYEKDQA